MAGFPRGAKPTPRYKLLAATPHRPTIAAPPQFAIVPKQLSYWYNNVDGDCVTAEEAYAKSVWAIMCGLDELFIPDAEVYRWAKKYGYLNGASLTEVMDAMAHDGFTVAGTNYKDGPYKGVDYSNDSILQSAISTGPVKIGIDANALPDGAGNHSGWYSIATGNFGNEDHCVGLSGYGTAEFIYSQLGLAVPAGLDPTTMGYLLFTWNTLGFVTHGWLMSTCQEAWVRNPTTLGFTPNPNPNPDPNPNPNPNPPTPTPPSPTTTFTMDFPQAPMTKFTGGFGTQKWSIDPINGTSTFTLPDGTIATITANLPEGQATIHPIQGAGFVPAFTGKFTLILTSKQPNPTPIPWPDI